MVPTGTPVFEMKAVRSLSATQLEIEFTEPVVAAAPSNFTVRQGISLQGGSANNESYGAGYQNTISTLTVTDVTLNSDKTRAALTITGLQQRPVATVPGSVEDRTWGSLIQINVTGVAAVSARAMWGDGAGGGVAWYTLNKFGPGVDAGTVISVAPAFSKDVPGLSFSRTAAGIKVLSPVSGGYTLRVSDLRGKTVASFNVGGGDFLIPSASLGAGMSVLEAKSADGQRWVAAVPKL
jgi:hypothetical protein